MDEKRKQFDDLVKRRDSTQEVVQRIQGRLDAARKDLSVVEDECSKKGVKPEQLDSAIQQLNKKLETAVAEFSAKIQEAEKTVTRFLED
jgi:predicted  nucleic acid-binding Zn-ribbon protein